MCDLNNFLYISEINNKALLNWNFSRASKNYIGMNNTASITNIQKEIWREINEYPGYFISTLGRLKSKNGYLKFQVNKGGYVLCFLYNKGVKTTLLLHRVVAFSFLKNKEKYPQINHKNGIKTDNTLINLEWCNQKQNTQHAINIGLLNCKGGDRPKLNIEIAEKIREEIYISNVSKLARKYLVARTCIQKILSYKTYRYKWKASRGEEVIIAYGQKQLGTFLNLSQQCISKNIDKVYNGYYIEKIDLKYED